MKKYIIVSGNEANPDELEKRVNSKINEGYTPLGGVAVRLSSGSGAVYLQAMVYEDTSST